MFISILIYTAIIFTANIPPPTAINANALSLIIKKPRLNSLAGFFIGFITTLSGKLLFLLKPASNMVGNEYTTGRVRLNNVGKLCTTGRVCLNNVGKLCTTNRVCLNNVGKLYTTNRVCLNNVGKLCTTFRESVNRTFKP